MTALVGQVPVTAISFKNLTEAPERREPAFPVAVPGDGRASRKPDHEQVDETDKHERRA
jgi:hypothetical protein